MQFHLAPDVWWGIAEQVLAYAREGHATHGRRTQAHAVLAARGEWVTAVELAMQLCAAAVVAAR